jgi:hypothetical protein
MQIVEKFCGRFDVSGSNTLMQNLNNTGFCCVAHVKEMSLVFFAGSKRFSGEYFGSFLMRRCSSTPLKRA